LPARWCFLVLTLAAASASAQLSIEITGAGAQRTPIAVAPFAGENTLAPSLSAIIRSDLERSGLFRILEVPLLQPALTEASALNYAEWRARLADALVVGSLVALPGGRFETRVRVDDTVKQARLGAVALPTTREALRAVGHRAADYVYEKLTGVRGVFGTEIAFTAHPAKGRGKEVYIVGMDGQNLRMATDNRSFNLFPRWSPDGQWLAYTSYRTGVPVIYLRNVSTGAEKELVRFGGTKSPGSFSPDGQWLYVSVSQDGDSNIYRVRVVGGDAQKVVEGIGLDVSPTAAPDGRRIAFVSDRGGSPQVYVKTLGQPAELRVSQGSGYATSPSWSPGGDRIAYTARVEGRFAIFSVAADGSDPREVIRAPDADCEDPSFAPDGRSLVYTYRKRGYSELKIISLDGRRERSLATGLGDMGSAAWSPR